MLEETNKKSYYTPQRLRDARIASGKTIKEVAEELEISAQAMSMFELGRCKLSVDMFFKIKNMYNLPISFYTKTYSDSINRSTVYFRSFSVATKKKREIAMKKAEFVSSNIVGFMSGKIKFPLVDPLFEKIKQSSAIEQKRNPEMWSKIIRREWKLTNGPIKNLILELERRGIIVVVVPMDDVVDGFSYWENGRPFIFVNKNNVAVRLRMSVAHELCHLFFHEEQDAELAHKEIENEAKTFAGAFLLPEREFCDDVYTTSLDHFLYLKSKWSVSIAAMVMRCHRLGIISEDKYTYLQCQLSRKKWKKVEPYDKEIEREQPILLKQAISLFINKKIMSKIDFIDQVGLDGKFIEENCSLDEGFFRQEDNLVSISF